jgi:hypothetical protein
MAVSVGRDVLDATCVRRHRSGRARHRADRVGVETAVVPASLLPVVNRKLAMEKPTANRKVAFAANAAIASTMIVSLVAAAILVIHRPQPLLLQGEVDGAGRLGTIVEIASAVLYLGSAEFTNGIVLPVDGGASAGC